MTVRCHFINPFRDQSRSY